MTSNAMKVTLYVVRHGECCGNLEQKAIDPFSDVLTEVGKAQAKLLGETLKNVTFTRAYASDYPRTYETAEIILRENDASKGVQLQPEKSLRERDYTGIIGILAADAISILMTAMKDGTPYLKVEMPDSETVAQFEERITKFFSDLIKDLRKSSRDEESVLIVSHGLTNQRLMVLLNSRPEVLGIQHWSRNLFTERLMRNTTFHKLSLEIPRSETGIVSGKVDQAHSRDHVLGESPSDSRLSRDVKDETNYTFLDKNEAEMSKYEDETVHYCKPV